VEFDPPPSPPDIILALVVISRGFFVSKNLDGEIEIYPLKTNFTYIKSHSVKHQELACLSSPSGQRNKKRKEKPPE
jgi:hypothetical protein